MIAIYLKIDSEYRVWSLIGFADNEVDARNKALVRLKYLPPGTKAEGRRLTRKDHAPEYPESLSGIGKKVDLEIKTEKPNVKRKKRRKRKASK